MSRRPPVPPLDDTQPTELDADLETGTDATSPGGSPALLADLATLPIAGITRRRMAAVLAGVLAAWIVIVFVRQVSEASAATARASDIAGTNVALQAEVAALDRELDLIARQRYIQQQARAYQLGRPKEIAFTLSADAPALADDAPGSAAVRLGAEVRDVLPLDSWLTVLFGPSD